MVTLVCWNCNKDIDVNFIDDITNCPNCGEKISKSVQKRTGKKGRNGRRRKVEK